MTQAEVARVSFQVVGLVGFLLVGYGGLRDAIHILAAGRPWGEGRFGEGSYGGKPPPIWAVVGKRLRLLPRDGQLTQADHKRNKVCFLVGFLLLLISLLAEFVLL